MRRYQYLIIGGGMCADAAARGIRIEAITTSLEGDINLHGLLGLDDSVSPGYEQIRIKMDIKADCSDAELDQLLAFTREHSPVCQSVCRPVPVVVERVAAASGHCGVVRQ